MLESFLKFISEYPMWVRAAIVATLAALLALLVLGRPKPPPDPRPPISTPKPEDPLYLKINGVALYPDDPNAEVQVVASVNRTEYIFPSVGNAKWMRVGPDMNRKVVQIPKADEYQ